MEFDAEALSMLLNRPYPEVGLAGRIERGHGVENNI